MLRLSLMLGVFALTACDRQPAPAAVATSEEASVEVRFPVRQGSVGTRLRLAVTDLEKRRRRRMTLLVKKGGCSYGLCVGGIWDACV